MVKMIYKNIPVKFISGISKKEANSKKPIYQVHKWFGRKTDAIFRSILLSLQLDEDNIDTFSNNYYKDNHDVLRGKIILDPFMGGGVTLVNTLRFGGKVVGIDINPVAWFITKNELQLPNRNKREEYYSIEELTRRLEEEFHKLEESIGREIKEIYTTTICDSDKKIRKEVDIMYTLWVKRVKCPSCGKYVRLFPTHSITKIHRKSFENYNVCPRCGEIVRGNELELHCSNCGLNFEKDRGNYKGRNFICSGCGEKFNLVRDIMRKRKTPLSSSMYAIQYYDPDTGKKGFKVPDKEDLNKYNAIRKKAKNITSDISRFIPHSKIPNGYNTKQIQNHNYRYWKQMFNDRQLYYLSRLLEEIDKIPDLIIKELFLCVFSNTINANNMFCIYNSQCMKIEPLFGDHHMAPVMNPVENNIWGTRFGRGSFTKSFKGILQSKKFNYFPYERLIIDGKNSNKVIKSEEFHSEFASDFNELTSKNKNTILKYGSAENLSFLPSRSIDAVITDPPYYSAINYGELSEFFYSWSKLILEDKYDFFQSEHIISDNEVTVSEAKGITKDEFIFKLTRCFTEIKRVLKEDAPLILTYNNSCSEGWQALAQPMFNSGFIVEKTYPVHTELRAGLIDNRREKMNYDLIIVARVKENSNNCSIQINEFLEKVEIEFQKTYLELEDENLSIIDMNLIRVGKVFEIYSQCYTNIYKGDTRISFQDILECIYKKIPIVI